MFQPDLLNGKRVLITGGGSGLGKAMGRRLMELGVDLMICGRRKHVLEETANDFEALFSRKVRTHPIDIRSAEAVEELMDLAFAEGALDVLINNAAGNFIARTETLSNRAVDAILNVVLHGTAYCTLAAGGRWIGQGRGGVVLSIVASYAWTGSPYVVPSAMAKAGVLAMTQSLAVEWGPKKIRTVAISPGSFPTAGAWDRLVHGRWRGPGRTQTLWAARANMMSLPIFVPIWFPTRPLTSTVHASPLMVAAGCRARGHSRLCRA